ncbi:MAG TPA: transcription termination factor NusA [Candidatus Gracilibacteria bacterium]
MQTPFQAAVNQLCAEKNLDKTVIIEAIEKAIALAYKKDFGTPGQMIKVHIGDDISQMRIFEEREVVEKVENIERDITLKEARVVRPDAKLEDIVYVPVEHHENFGRIAAQAAKQVITQKIQEAERMMLFEKFKDREGQLLTARVQKVAKDAVLLDVDGVSTMLGFRDQIPGEKYFTGQRIKVYLSRVEQTSKGSQLIINRTSPNFVIALFEQEIPEMKDGLVSVARIAREPGVRCKVAVISEDSGLDPVGAFVGQKGSRINVVMEELGDERLDVIQYYEDPVKLLKAALSPAKIVKIEIDQEGNDKRAKVFVPESERAITIGKKGQNIRLAGNLVGMQVDAVTYDGPIEDAQEDAPEKEKAARKDVDEEIGIKELKGVDPEVIEILEELGLSQVKQFEGLKAEELAEVGITFDQAKAVVKAVDKYLKS